jgi:hypothetical protein
MLLPRRGELYLESGFLFLVGGNHEGDAVVVVKAEGEPPIITSVYITPICH